jgi:protein-S-isoprenylcysteine O-methyltransferase Ste14
MANTGVTQPRPDRLVQPPAALLLALVLLVLIHAVLPGPRLLAYPANLVGLLPLALGVYLNLAADALLKRHSTIVKVRPGSTALVTEGVYRHTRNPMYLGFVLLLAGLALLLGSACPLLVVAAFAVAIQWLYIPREETMLRERFGEEWADYRAQVRRWL